MKSAWVWNHTDLVSIPGSTHFLLYGVVASLRDEHMGKLLTAVTLTL